MRKKGEKQEQGSRREEKKGRKTRTDDRHVF